MVTCDTLGSVIFWDIPTGGVVRKWRNGCSAPNSIALSADGQRVAIAYEDILTVRVIRSGQKLWNSGEHSGRITAVTYGFDGSYIITSHNSGAVILWDTQSGDQIATFGNGKEKDFLVLTPEGYYQASRGGLKAVAFRLGDSVFPFEQFDLRLNRPDRVLQRLGKVPPETISAHKAAYIRRLKKMGFTEDMLGEDLHLPTVTIQSKDLPISSNTKSLTFRVRANDTKYELDRINVWINDVRVNPVPS